MTKTPSPWHQACRRQPNLMPIVDLARADAPPPPRLPTSKPMAFSLGLGLLTIGVLCGLSIGVLVAAAGRVAKWW